MYRADERDFMFVSRLLEVSQERKTIVADIVCMSPLAIGRLLSIAENKQRFMRTIERNVQTLPAFNSHSLGSWAKEDTSKLRIFTYREEVSLWKNGVSTVGRLFDLNVEDLIKILLPFEATNIVNRLKELSNALTAIGRTTYSGNCDYLARMPTELLYCSPRSANALFRAGLYVMGALWNMCPEEIMAIPNVGRSSCKEIIDRTKEFLIQQDIDNTTMLALPIFKNSREIYNPYKISPKNDKINEPKPKDNVDDILDLIF